MAISKNQLNKDTVIKCKLNEFGVKSSNLFFVTSFRKYSLLLLVHGSYVYSIIIILGIKCNTIYKM